MTTPVTVVNGQIVIGFDASWPERPNVCGATPQSVHHPSPIPPGVSHCRAPAFSLTLREAEWLADLAKVREAAHTKADSAREADDRSHAEVQFWLRDLGRALGYDVHVATNDRNRDCGAGRLGDGCIAELPARLRDAPGSDAVRLIDVLWIRGDEVVAAFEVEHSTSIYSGIVRLLDLSLGAPSAVARELFIVAPDDRESEVQAQVCRPAFKHVADLRVRYLPYGELERHRQSMGRFGEGLKAIQAVSRVLT